MIPFTLAIRYAEISPQMLLPLTLTQVDVLVSAHRAADVPLCTHTHTHTHTERVGIYDSLSDETKAWK